MATAAYPTSRAQPPTSAPTGPSPLGVLLYVPPTAAIRRPNWVRHQPTSSTRAVAATNAGSVADPDLTSTIEGTTTMAADGARADTDCASTSRKLSRRRRRPATGDRTGSRTSVLRAIPLPRPVVGEPNEPTCRRRKSRMRKRDRDLPFGVTSMFHFCFGHVTSPRRWGPTLYRQRRPPGRSRPLQRGRYGHRLESAAVRPRPGGARAPPPDRPARPRRPRLPGAPRGPPARPG